METGLPRPILPIGAMREVREIADRSGVAGPPVEVMPLPENSFQRGDMTAEMLKDPRLLNLDTFEKARGDEKKLPRAPAGGKPAEDEDAPYQLELGAQKALAKAKSEALETMLAYERLGRGVRRTAPMPRPRDDASALKEPVSAPRPAQDGPEGSPAYPQDETAKGAPRPAVQGEETPFEPVQGDAPPADTEMPESAAPGAARPDAQRAPGPIEPEKAPPLPCKAPAAPPNRPEEAVPAQEQSDNKAALPRGISVRDNRVIDAAREALQQSGAPDSRGSIENLQRFTKLPFYLYLFGGEMPRYTDEEEARAIRSRRGRRAEPDWTAETLTMADAVRLAAVLHSVYFGGDGAFGQAKPWYMPYLRYALEQGILYAGEFGAPDDPVTRGHLADILARCVPDEALPAINPNTTVSDVKEGVGYGSSAIKMVRAGVFAPVGPLELFDPERLVTRREAAVYVGRILTPSDRRRF